MARRSGTDWVKISGYAFLLGVLIAIVAGIIGPQMIPYTGTLLIVLGAIVGLLGAFGIGSIDRASATEFLIATVALVAVGASGDTLIGIPTIGPYLSDIVGYIAIFVAPAVVIIALEAIWSAGSTKL
jgi:hypothetical protein